MRHQHLYRRRLSLPERSDAQAGNGRVLYDQRLELRRRDGLVLRRNQPVHGRGWHHLHRATQIR
jgi:hypothetical protein